MGKCLAVDAGMRARRVETRHCRRLDRNRRASFAGAEDGKTMRLPALTKNGKLRRLPRGFSDFPKVHSKFTPLSLSPGDVVAGLGA
ncbi:hypothetical protein NDK50_11880 [Paraburkholderia bryophila]|uniref:hypothetical protein n=1 Tax=Paraburkholderia bryophila TaxID=420952 RepID=UPI00234AD533|nr:hypothetical protein [Paraburkholderia bryophila]WCM18178.1 hypothetical protein NDK50_11880 [Paraburkholderia bryophila]